VQDRTFQQLLQKDKSSHEEFARRNAKIETFVVNYKYDTKAPFWHSAPQSAVLKFYALIYKSKARKIWHNDALERHFGIMVTSAHKRMVTFQFTDLLFIKNVDTRRHAYRCQLR
jgi:hypothetical protein